MKTLISRLKAPTPGWFKTIINLALTLAGVGTSIQVALQSGLHIPNFLTTLANYFIVGGMIAASIAKTAKEDKPGDTVVTQPNGTNTGTSSLPVILLVIALGCCLLTGCSRKVALQKSTVHTQVDSAATASTVYKHNATNGTTVQAYYGDTITGNLFINADTVPGTAPVYDSVTSGGIKLKFALVKAGSGYKALYYAVAKPVTTTTTTQASNADSGASAQTVDLKKATDTSSKSKQVQAPVFSFGKLVLILALLVVIFIIIAIFKPQLQTAFGWFIALFKRNKNAA